jgi:NADPH:quinone reductase-like Zn-dependent oxidoreductase
MKAILCSQYCGPDDLVLADIPDPVAGPGEAVISIKAAALNFFDLLMIQGKYQIKPPFPFSPAAEVAGVIESVGAGVTSLKVGDRVVASCGHNGAPTPLSKFPTIWISTAPPASSSFTAPRCMRWRIAPARRRVRPWRCSAPPAAPVSPHANSAS